MSEPIDTYRDAFMGFLKQGMTHAEALAQFDEKEWRDALVAELEPGMTRLDRATFEHVTNDERKLPTLLSLSSIALREQMNVKDMEKAIALWLAGWTSEKPHEARQVDVMSWYWRRPSRRPGKPGRRYLSTNQAYNAMMREAP